MSLISFNATIQKFKANAHQTGWTYITVTAKQAAQLQKGSKKSFRVKGLLDDFKIEKVALLPTGNGDFIIPVNAAMRKGIGKQQGATVKVQLHFDDATIAPPKALLECLEDEPKAMTFYNSLTQGHKNYFTKWIETAKTEATQAKRIALVINAMLHKMDFGAMLRQQKEDNKKLRG
jgi:hypothetical protein